MFMRASWTEKALTCGDEVRREPGGERAGTPGVRTLASGCGACRPPGTVGAGEAGGVQALVPGGWLAAGQEFHRAVRAAVLSGPVGGRGVAGMLAAAGGHGRRDLAAGTGGPGPMLVIIEIQGTGRDKIPAGRARRNLRRQLRQRPACLDTAAEERGAGRWPGGIAGALRSPAARRAPRSRRRSRRSRASNPSRCPGVNKPAGAPGPCQHPGRRTPRGATRTRGMRARSSWPVRPWPPSPPRHEPPHPRPGRRTALIDPSPAPGVHGAAPPQQAPRATARCRPAKLRRSYFESRQITSAALFTTLPVDACPRPAECYPSAHPPGG